MQEQITVVQLWSTEGQEQQAGLLRTMGSRVGVLQKHPGFISLTTLQSVDGGFVAVQGLWSCLADAESAVNSAEARAGHQDMLVWGSPRGASFRVVDVFEPRASGDNDPS